MFSILIPHASLICIPLGFQIAFCFSLCFLIACDAHLAFLT